MIRYSLCGSIRELLCTVRCKCKFNNILNTLKLVLICTSGCRLNIGTFKDYRAVCLKFFYTLIESAGVSVIVGISVSIILSYEIQLSGLTEFFKDCICIFDTGYLDADTVIALLINLRLCTVAFHTTLELIDRIIHIRI